MHSLGCQFYGRKCTWPWVYNYKSCVHWQLWQDAPHCYSFMKKGWFYAWFAKLLNSMKLLAQYALSTLVLVSCQGSFSLWRDNLISVIETGFVVTIWIFPGSSGCPHPASQHRSPLQVQSVWKGIQDHQWPEQTCDVSLWWQAFSVFWLFLCLPHQGHAHQASP